jgi:3-oxoacyl-[acyl-carrier protein] reductase
MDKQKKLVYISGTAQGIGCATAKLFLEKGYRVYGFDIRFAPRDLEKNENYRHFVVDISKESTLPQIEQKVRETEKTLESISVVPDILINCAGVQNSGKDIAVNLQGTINFTEKYGIHCDIKSILMVASASAHTGAEFPEYSASKGGMITYMKNVAMRVAKYGATCNSISPGGVTTELNEPVMKNANLWEQIMQLTPLRRWMSPEECADWIYFLTVTNRFCTGQDILVDGGEKDLNAHFIWPNGRSI